MHRTTTLCGKALDGILHVCAFVESREEGYDLLLPFLKEAGAQRHRVMGMVGPEQRDAWEAWTKQHRLPANDVLTWSDSLLQDGRFSSGVALDLLERQHVRAQLDGFGGLRGFADMAWASKTVDGELLEYEVRVNDVLGRYHDALICLYDVKACPVGLMRELIDAHPTVVLDGSLHQNRHWRRPRLRQR